MRSLSIAATGMLAQQLNVEVISNNIANLNTTAFKAQRAEFQDLLYQNERNVGVNSSDSGTIVPVGVQIGSVTRQNVRKNGTFSDAETASNSPSSCFSAVTAVR